MPFSYENYHIMDKAAVFDISIDELPMPERIGRLRDAMLAEPRFVSIEQARIVTRVYQEHAGEPRILVVSDIERDLTEHQSLSLANELCEVAHRTGACVVCGVNDYDLAAVFDTATCITYGARAQREAWERKHHEGKVA